MLMIRIPWDSDERSDFEDLAYKHFHRSQQPQRKLYLVQWEDIENRWTNRKAPGEAWDYWRALTPAGELWILANMPENAEVSDEWPFSEDDE